MKLRGAVAVVTGLRGRAAGEAMTWNGPLVPRADSGTQFSNSSIRMYAAGPSDPSDPSAHHLVALLVRSDVRFDVRSVMVSR